MREEWRGVGEVGMGRKEGGGVERSGRSGEEWGEVRSGEEED